MSGNRPRLCPLCRTPNDRAASVCKECGAQLKAAPAASGKKLPWYALPAGGLVLVLCIYGIMTLTRKKPAAAAEDAAEPAPVSVSKIPAGSQPKLGFESGTLIIQDFSGRELIRTESLLMNRSWVALPVWITAGGERWIFVSSENKTGQINRGVWTKGDPVGIWQVEDLDRETGPNLAPWNRKESLLWRSLQPNAKPFVAQVAFFKRYQEIIGCMLPDELKQPGVFLQNNRIVGWTFGSGTNRGYLWAGSGGEGLDRRSTINQYIFSNNREAFFLKALNQPESSAPLEKLETLVRGFQTDPLLTEDDLPPFLHRPAINRRMIDLIGEIADAGSSREILEIFNSQVLTEIGDAGVLEALTSVVVEAQGFKPALRYFEDSKGLIREPASGGSQSLNTIHRHLYREWINRSIRQRDFIGGWEAREAARVHFPDDAEFHLFSVELSLAEDKWEKAQKLLDERTYPPELTQRVEAVRAILKDKSSQKDIVEIRFPPGSEIIPAEALINGTLRLKFIIDTGATAITIPIRAAQSLGLEMDVNSPMVPVTTAGGVEMAYRVHLDSVAIHELRANDLDALIVDIPGYPDTGLMGTNFLNLFHIEIDNQNGILRLSKR